MSRTDFLNTLCLTDFGKIICINLYRSLRLGTLTAVAVQNFMDACIAKYLAHFPVATGDPPKVDFPKDENVALHVAVQWGTRSAIVDGNLFQSPPSTKDPIQYAVILPIDTVTRDASSARVATYSARKVRNQSEFDALIKEWLLDDPIFPFGLGKKYFWLARPVDSASTDFARLSKGLAQFHLETLGLCHFGNTHTLARALMPAKITVGVSPLLRPTALDGIDNPAFRAAADSEKASPPKQPGLTPGCLRSRYTFWDIQVPKTHSIFDNFLCPDRPASVATPDSLVGEPSVTTPANGLTACRDALCIGPPLVAGFPIPPPTPAPRPRPTPIGDYQPSLRSPWLAAMDLHLIRSNAPTVDGQHEWLCNPLTIAATSVVWEFLGIPAETPCKFETSFHAQVLKQFEKSTPLPVARTYLDAIL